MYILYALFLFLGAVSVLPAQEAPAPLSPQPAYIALVPNVNDFNLFADGGWDGNWYVGFDSCWIVKLPGVPTGNYSKAFIGARLGRAKTRIKRNARSGEREHEIIPGKIYMAISSEPSFPSDKSFFLTTSKDIALEPLISETMPGLGESRWFWTEVPLRLVNSDRPNYLALWSNSDYFVSASSSPIVAGTKPKEAKEASAWLNRSIHGVAPRGSAPTPGTPLIGLQPALALKLVPRNSAVVTVGPLEITNLSGAIAARFSVRGENTELAWIELSHDQFTWERITPFLRHPPYIFTIPSRDLSRDGVYLRGAAKDSLENRGQGPQSPAVAPPD
ncbi:MAG: hypothetical protein HY399_04780 [Elusimicrobia bacterium]|nr:hypothetical protein [Elusimicrobiota bacterium]